MFKAKSLRFSMIAIVVLMGLVAASIVFISTNIFRHMVFESERVSLSELVQLKVADLLKEHYTNTKKLGLSIQLDPSLRKFIKTREIQKIPQLLDNQFHQYFVTAGVVKLKGLFVFDTNYELLTRSNMGDIFDKDGVLPCQSLISIAKKRLGPSRLKPMSGLCNIKGQSGFATIVPVGGLRPIAYILIITDPVSALVDTEVGLGMAIRITHENNQLAYQSKNWPNESDLANFVSIRHHLRDENENVVATIAITRNIGVFEEKWQTTSLTVLLLTVLFIFCAIVISLLILHRALKPLEKLRGAAEQLSNGKFEQISETSFPEIDIPIQSFNVMAKKIVQLIGSLESEIHERKNIEMELRDHRNHLEELVRERTEDLAEARDAAMEASRAKSAFLANMSHELRTPLNAIIGYSEMIIDDADAGIDLENLPTDLVKITQSGKHLLNLINGILDLSKIEAGKMELEYLSFDLNEFIQDTILSVQPQIELSHNRFELKLAENIGSIVADSTKLRQSLINLLGNASKFTKDGVIGLEVRLEKVVKVDVMDWLVFIVSDTGIGISKKQQELLYKDFTQADSSTTRIYGGTGLGLSISLRFCQMMGGTLSVESEVGKGSVFTIRIPRVTDKFHLNHAPTKAASG